MEITFELANTRHINLLLEMMRKFYSDDRGSLDEPATKSALHQILSDSSLGRVYLMLANGDIAGYIVLTLRFSLEHHGCDAFINEIYVKESYHGGDIWKRGLQFIEDVCREIEVKALHLELERADINIQAECRKEGFVDRDRYLMTRRVK